MLLKKEQVPEDQIKRIALEVLYTPDGAVEDILLTTVPVAWNRMSKTEQAQALNLMLIQIGSYLSDIKANRKSENAYEGAVT